MFIRTKKAGSSHIRFKGKPSTFFMGTITKINSYWEYDVSTKTCPYCWYDYYCFWSSVPHNVGEEFLESQLNFSHRKLSGHCLLTSWLLQPPRELELKNQIRTLIEKKF